MRRLLYISVLLISCGTPEEQAPPDDLISREKMAEVIVDMNLVEAQIAEVQLIQQVIKDSVHTYYGQLFAKHGITREQLNESVDYYTTKGEVMDSIYSDALSKLVQMEQELDSVEIQEEVLTHIPGKTMHQLLNDSNLLEVMTDDTLSYPLKHDSILRYFRKNQYLLDSVNANYRQFGVSLNFYAGNQKKLNKVLADILQKRERNE